MGILDDETDLLEESFEAEPHLLESLWCVIPLLDCVDGLRGQTICLDGQEPSGSFDGIWKGSVKG